MSNNSKRANHQATPNAVKTGSAQRSPFGRVDVNASAAPPGQTPSKMVTAKSVRKPLAPAASISSNVLQQSEAAATPSDKIFVKPLDVGAPAAAVPANLAPAAIASALCEADKAPSSSPRLLSPCAAPAVAAAAAEASASSATRHICRLCGVGPLPSHAQLQEHLSGKRHHARFAHVQLRQQWMPSNAARTKAKALALSAWQQELMAMPTAAAATSVAAATLDLPLGAPLPTTAMAHAASSASELISADVLAPVVFEADSAECLAEKGAAAAAASTVALMTATLAQAAHQESAVAVDDDNSAKEVAAASCVCSAMVASTGMRCTLRAKSAGGRCGRHKAAKFAAPRE